MHRVYVLILSNMSSSSQIHCGKCEERKDGFAIVYSAIWKNGPLSYSYFKKKLTRESDKKVALKCLYESKDITNEFLKEVKNFPKIYGISQNLDTEDYIMVFHNEYFEYLEKQCKSCHNIKLEDKWCNSCHVNFIRKNFISCNSGNKEIDEYIQGMQSNISNPNAIVFEWIPYYQFDNINEIGKDDTYAIYSAIWKNGPLHYEYMTGWVREPNKKVALKCFQNANNEFLNEVETYSANCYNDNLIYGISQNPSTKDYIIVIQDKYNKKCVECGKKYIDMQYEWYNPCQINHLRNEKIDSFIQEMRTNNESNNIDFNFIPYNQFNNVKEIGGGGFSKVYSAIWKNGPRCYSDDEKEWRRIPNKKVALKCSYDSQNFTKEFLNEVKTHLALNTEFFINIYGISQNSDTKDYIMILDYAEGGSFNNWLNNNYKEFSWSRKLKVLLYIIQGLKVIHQKSIVHRDLHTGNILFTTNNIDDFNVVISDTGLCGKVGNTETNIYGIMSYVAPEVLKGKHYTEAADIYSFGMIMYFAATGKQPFNDFAHDSEVLALNICNGTKPEINELKMPKCYVDLMKRCWDSNPKNRPSAIEVEKLITKFKLEESEEIKKQFKVAEEYRKADPLNNKSVTIQTQPAEELQNDDWPVDTIDFTMF
ncbi:kinase-like domain-containing protein [Rhizophagus clarus]|uniref:Kinase-like domain-containing protein n=1 Tax=Rhizophagus clarus TaxID=94130 RepID=A0A8H3M2D6_9GLOM|nr:kinase-like domain-containing protein [Rhizophagus clarus]